MLGYLAWLVTSGFVFRRVDIFGDGVPCGTRPKKGVVKGEEPNLYSLTQGEFSFLCKKKKKYRKKCILKSKLSIFDTRYVRLLTEYIIQQLYTI